jgi:chromosome segregation ATPase
MIGALSKQLGQQLEEVGLLEQQQQEVKSIQATLDKLDNLKSTTQSLKKQHQVLWSRFPDDTVQSIRQTAASMVQALEQSRDNFEKQRRQVRELSNVETDAKKLLKQVNDQWSLYVSAQLAPHIELLKLVQVLPEIVRQEQEINELLNQFEALKTNPPSSAPKLAEFDTKLQQLSERLAIQQGLSPAVREFLQKVQQGTATLNDLSDDILAWCRQGDHARAFAISFRHGSGKRS